MPSLEDLKKAQEQLNKSGDLSERNPPFTISRAVSERQREVQKPKEDAHGTEGWLSHQDWLKEISDERQRLEKIYKEIENRQRKVQERLAIVKELEEQSQRINKELKDLQQKIVLVKKENNTIFYQIKNEYGNNDIKSDSEK